MDDASIQRFGLALVVAGAAFHLHEVARYPNTDWATFGGFLLFGGLLAAGWPFVSLSVTEGSSEGESPDADQ